MTNKSDLTQNSNHRYSVGGRGPAFMLPNVTCVSAVFAADDEFPFCRNRFAYRVHQTSLADPAMFIFGDQGKAKSQSAVFVFSDLERAKNQRRELVARLIEFWGPEALLFANGFHSPLCVVSAIREISEMTTTAEGLHAFDVEVAGVEQPITVMKADKEMTTAVRGQLSMHLEQIRIARCKPVKIAS